MGAKKNTGFDFSAKNTKNSRCASSTNFCPVRIHLKRLFTDDVVAAVVAVVVVVVVVVVVFVFVLVITVVVIDDDVDDVDLRDFFLEMALQQEQFGAIINALLSLYLKVLRR